MQMLNEGLRERVRWAGYGLIAGLIIGILLGWMFHGFVGALIKIGIVLIFAVPFVAAVLFYLSSRRGSTKTITVRDASWRDINRPRGDRS